MIKRFFSYLMIASIVAVGFTACSDDDDNTPKEKTAEEIKAENLAEFKELIGTGVGNKKFEVGSSTKEIDKLVGAEFDKLSLSPVENKEVQDYILFDGINYVFNQSSSNIQVKGSVFDFKVEDGVYTIYANKDSAKKVYFRGELTDGSHAIKIIYNSKDKTVTQFWGGYQKGQYLGTFISKFKAEPYTAKASSEKAVVKTRSVASRSSANFIGTHYVYVELQPTHWTANFPALILKPKGYHYVKFTQKSNGKIQAQFCDASGTVGGDNDSDYYYSTTKHFWKNKMPMALNLYNVDFSYTNGTISSGTNVMAHARDNQNPDGSIPSFFLGGLLVQNSGANADIITTTGNTADNFELKVKLDFALPFNCVITK